MPTASATIETLTATVNTLVVGSRQVTLSIAKQLDVVPLRTLTIFGRVRLSDAVRVIGATPDGTLALADIRPPQTLWNITAGDLSDEPIAVCHGRLVYETFDSYAIHLPSGEEIVLWRPSIVTCNAKGPGATFCAGWEDGGPAFAALEQLFNEHVARHRQAAEAPLIVLAGLR